MVGRGGYRIAIEEGMSPLMYNIMVVGVLYYWTLVEKGFERNRRQTGQFCVTSGELGSKMDTRRTARG